MSVPDLTVNVEPSIDGKVIYSMLAPKIFSSNTNGFVGLMLSIFNNGTKRVRVNELRVYFVGNPPPPDSKTIALNLVIDPHKGTNWFFSNLIVKNMPRLILFKTKPIDVNTRESMWSGSLGCQIR